MFVHPSLPKALHNNLSSSFVLSWVLAAAAAALLLWYGIQHWWIRDNGTQESLASQESRVKCTRNKSEKNLYVESALECAQLTTRVPRVEATNRSETSENVYCQDDSRWLLWKTVSLVFRSKRCLVKMQDNYLHKSRFGQCMLCLLPISGPTANGRGHL